MTQAYNSFNLEQLCILKGQQCWKLYADILILECGGNLYDAISLAVKASLFTTQVPSVSGTLLDGGNVDLLLSDDPFNCQKLDVTNVPLMVTLCKVSIFSYLWFFFQFHCHLFYPLNYINPNNRFAIILLRSSK